jgi:hypothetical protein
MYYVADKQFEGISLKLSEVFLKENDLRWDETKFYYEKLPEVKFNSSVAQVQKLNLLSIASELNLPKIYIQSGLNNLFRAVASLLTSSSSCLLDLGFLGNLHSVNKLIHHIPTKLKKDSLLRKKTTIKTLIGKYKEKDNSTTNSGLNLVSNNHLGLLEDKNRSKEVFNPADNNQIGTFTNEKIEKNSIEKLKLNIKINREVGDKITYENNSQRSEIMNLNKSSNISMMNNNLKKSKDKVILVPIREQEWRLKEMLNSTFKRSDKSKMLNSVPILFNAYSNTKAAPFTSEKTQIPIAHRVASFYSLSLQNFIIDKTTILFFADFFNTINLVLL